MPILLLERKALSTILHVISSDANSYKIHFASLNYNVHVYVET